MQPSPKQYEILRATAAFATVERYQGTLPKRQALLYDKKDLAALTEAGWLELVKLSFPCGKDVHGWRLTETGREWLLEQRCGEADSELVSEHLRILNDVYHYSRISRFRGMMPKECGKDYDDDDLRDLFTHGYLLRICVKGATKSKGWVVSSKGLDALRLRRNATAVQAPACSSQAQA